MTTRELVSGPGAPLRREERPDPDWVRGNCPCCEEVLVANVYYAGKPGYVIVWECWGSLAHPPTCDYRRIL